MFVRVLECAACQTTFNTRKEWLTHLLQPYHQSKAREEICRWDQSERDCALVAFSALPIASLELLQFFSKGSMDLVTDFVWFDNHPKMGFIQFESKYKVEVILTSFRAPEVHVNNQLVQIKRAGECLQLEWEALIPSAFDKLQEGSNEQECESNPNPPLDIIINQNKPLNVPNIAATSRVPDPAEFLSTQYDLICQEIEIPNEEYEVATSYLEILQTRLVKKYPHCQLVWFRNWYLKLKSTTSSNELIFFIDQKGKYGKHLTDMHANLEEFPPVRKGGADNMFVGVPHICKTTVADQSFKFRQDFLCAKTNLVFSMVSVPAALFPEIQACRLVAYYCSFDSRIKPLLTVIRYWAKINGIQLANANSNDVSHKRAPDPAALDWLVVFFLSHKMKMLPTPREVTERPHPKFSWSNFDIGFSFDLNFAKTFFDRYKEPTITKECHSLNTFHLAIKFFKFYSKELRLLTGRKITLNTRDGEIIETKEFGGYLRDIPTKLPLEERQMAKKGRKIGIVAEMAINLLHPLYPAHGFSICDKNFVETVCSAMERTSKKLKRALVLYKKGKEFDIKSVLQVIL